jgi:hypothetical protein
MIDPTYKIDCRQTQYAPPQSFVAALVQQPSYLIDGHSLADAYMRDERAKRKEKT